jgi:RimJ/RimL family protein N-acetyltransferase
MTRIVTDRLILRPVEDRDLEGLFAVLSHPVAMRYWSTEPHADRTVTQASIDSMRVPTSALNLDFIIEYRGVAVGKVGARRPPEFGYILHPDLWGQGLAREATMAFIAHVTAVGLDRLTADVDPRNAASIRLLQLMGFEETGRAENTFFIAQEWCHSIYFERRLTR